MAKVYARNLRIATLSSMILASHTVQVTTDANASPSITPSTRTSADANIDQGDKSRGRLTAVRGASEVARGAARLASGGVGAGDEGADVPESVAG
jgi:hypothetical protein